MSTIFPIYNISYISTFYNKYESLRRSFIKFGEVKDLFISRKRNRVGEGLCTSKYVDFNKFQILVKID